MISSPQFDAGRGGGSGSRWWWERRHSTTVTFPEAGEEHPPAIVGRDNAS
jgi:hypothetical protein